MNFWKARFIASYKFVKREPRAIARFGGIFSRSCFSRSVWSREPWCPPCKLRYTVVSMSHIISAGTKSQHIRPLWSLLRLGSKIMLLRMGLLLRLGSNVITDGTFITLGSSYYTCAFNKLPFQHLWIFSLPFVQVTKLQFSHFFSNVRCLTILTSWFTCCLIYGCFASGGSSRLNLQSQKQRIARFLLWKNSYLPKPLNFWSVTSPSLSLSAALISTFILKMA